MKIGNVDVRWLGHASFLLQGSKVVYIDPYNLTLDEPKADIILITHSHYDHCSVSDIEKIVKPGSIVIMPADCQSKVTRLNDEVDMRIVEPGSEVEVEDVKIKAVPAYNSDKEFHPKEEGWCGYVVTLDGITIYHAGDTDIIEEMKELAGKVDVALLPVGGTYTMNADEAAQVATIIKPRIAVPMHYGSIVGSKEDAKRFVELCEQAGIRAEILEK